MVIVCGYPQVVDDGKLLFLLLQSPATKTLLLHLCEPVAHLLFVLYASDKAKSAVRILEYI